MLDYMDWFLEDLISFFNSIARTVLANEIIQIFFGIFLVTAIVGALLRVVLRGY